jgi:hypothetical protein
MKKINILFRLFIILCLVINCQGSTPGGVLGTPSFEGNETQTDGKSGQKGLFGTPLFEGTETQINRKSGQSGILGAPAFMGMPPISTIPSRGSSIAYYTPSWYSPAYGEPIKIRKEIVPESPRKDYVMGDKLWVTVEVINIKNDMVNVGLKNIYIREIVDNELQVVAASEDHINKEPLIDLAMTDSLKDICYNELKLFRGESINYNIKTIKIGNDEIYKDAVICSNETLSYPLFEWRGALSGDVAERNKLNNSLSEIFGLAWIKENASINGSLRMIQNGRNVSVIYINRTDYKEKNEYVRLQIDDVDNISSTGDLTLDISGDRFYELKYKVGNNKSINVYDWDTIIELDIDELRPKQKLIYRYSIKPKRSGAFNLKSMVRIVGNENLALPDIIYPTVMEVEDPDLSFRVVPILEKDHIYPDIWQWDLTKWFDKILTLKYEIIFTGDTLRQYRDNILIELDDPPKGSHYIDEKGDGFNFKANFSKDKVYTVSKDIIFEDSGKYIMPGITVEGNHYLFGDEKITVEDTWAFLLGKLIAFNTFIIIIGSFLAKKQIKEFVAYLRKRIFGKKNQERDNDTELRDKVIEIIGVWSTSSQEIKNLQKEVEDLKNRLNEKNR